MESKANYKRKKRARNESWSAFLVDSLVMMLLWRLKLLVYTETSSTVLCAVTSPEGCTVVRKHVKRGSDIRMP